MVAGPWSVDRRGTRRSRGAEVQRGKAETLPVSSLAPLLLGPSAPLLRLTRVALVGTPGVGETVKSKVRLAREGGERG
jgi:hypothetical protein